jgi:hypothetical protein
VVEKINENIGWHIYEEFLHKQSLPFSVESIVQMENRFLQPIVMTKVAAIEDVPTGKNHYKAIDSLIDIKEYNLLAEKIE